MIFLTFLLSDGNKVMFLLAMLPNLKTRDIGSNLNFVCLFVSLLLGVYLITPDLGGQMSGENRRN